MINKRLKQSLLVLPLAFLLAVSPCLASVTPNTQEVLQNLITNLELQETELVNSLQEIRNSKDLSQQQMKKINELEISLEKLQILIESLKLQLQEQKTELNALSQSIDTANNLLEATNKELQKEKRKGNYKSIVWGVIGVGAGYLAGRALSK